MSIEVKVPTLPESVADAQLVTWHKKVGDSVRRDENLVDIETDKVVLEVPAPNDGILREIRRNEGDTVKGSEVIAIIEAGEAAAHEAEREPEPDKAAKPDSAGAAPPPMGPAARRLVSEHGLDPGRIQGTGKDGRITKGDVLAHLQASGETGVAAPATPAPQEPAPPAPPAPAPAPDRRAVRRERMSRLRSRIAERMVEAQRTAAILTTFNEVNMQPVMELRRRYRERFEKRHGVRLGMMSFFVRACTEALKRYPVINASVDGDEIVHHDFYDIGIAVGTDRGLVVPILRDADQMDFATIENRIAHYGRQAREGTLSMDDLTGGTFTITNGGVFGSMLSTPILNPPQSAILGMHKIQERPIAENGEVVIRPIMYLALSYDHRIIDGREAVQFLVAVKEALEDPARMLLAI
jgi:2-oxoglutarate dehydrogenase E2 component (dihydrolipoamide succinyltransferase)